MTSNILIEAIFTFHKRWLWVKMLLLVLSFLLCTAASAQTKSTPSYQYGFKFGVTTAKISGTHSGGSARVTFQGGAWCQITLRKKWTAQAELIYIEKGIDGYFKGQAALNSYALSLMYAELPVLFQYHNKNSSFEFGPGMGVLFYQYESVIGSNGPNAAKLYPFSKKELSFNIGYGHTLNNKLKVMLLFSHSLLPIRKEVPNFSTQIYNRVLSVTLCRSIKFKKPKVTSAED